MKRLGFVLSAAFVVTAVHAFVSSATGRFDQKLTIDKQIVHVLNRLTFGARPADVEQVRRLGIDKWIDLQLHPERISENPTLETKLKPLDSLQLQTWEIQENYMAVPPFAPNRFASPLSVIPPQQFATLMNCSVDERQKMLASFDPDKRHQLLAVLPPQALEGLPADMQQAAKDARQAEQEARQKEIRRLMPPLNELLTPDQM